MARRDLLTGDERRALFGVPLDHASLAKHYTVADEDRPLIEAKRGDANRLGFALHLALLRHPGFGIRHDDVVPDFLIRHLAAQLDIAPTAFEGYAHRAQTRLEHAWEAMERLRLRAFEAADVPGALGAATRATRSAPTVAPSSRMSRFTSRVVASMPRFCAALALANRRPVCLPNISIAASASRASRSMTAAASVARLLRSE